MNRRTKIICTIGPSSENEETIRTLVAEGMDVARINFSHCPYDEALARIEKLRRVRDELDVPLGIMLDTKGPEVRVFGFDGPILVNRGDEIEIESQGERELRELPRGKKRLHTNLPGIAELCQPGTRILLHDGFLEATVTAVGSGEPSHITVRLENSGVLKEKIHLAIPGADYPLPFLSCKDKDDIVFAVRNRFEFIALSFVRSAEDIHLVRGLVSETDPHWPIKLIAKIEDRQALTNLDAIIQASDGIMVARGDLGVEVAIEQLPVLQKHIIEKCYLSGRPVIVATQMLESMTEKTYPTRAEVTDVANAVHDFTSAVMLSGETANGVHPDKVVSMMRRIVQETEGSINYKEKVRANRDYLEREDLTNIMSYSAITTAHQCGAKAICVITMSGYGARSISKFRPGVPIHAFTFSEAVRHQLALSWGVMAHQIDMEDCQLPSLVQHVVDLCHEKGIAQPGEKVVVVAGVPLGEVKAMNMIRVETVGESGRKSLRAANPFAAASLHLLHPA